MRAYTTKHTIFISRNSMNIGCNVATLSIYLLYISIYQYISCCTLMLHPCCTLTDLLHPYRHLRRKINNKLINLTFTNILNQ